MFQYAFFAVISSHYNLSVHITTISSVLFSCALVLCQKSKIAINIAFSTNIISLSSQSFACNFSIFDSYRQQFWGERRRMRMSPFFLRCRANFFHQSYCFVFILQFSPGFCCFWCFPHMQLFRKSEFD